MGSLLSTPSLGITRRSREREGSKRLQHFQLPLSGSLVIRNDEGKELHVTFNSLSRDHWPSMWSASTRL